MSLFVANGQIKGESVFKQNINITVSLRKDGETSQVGFVSIFGLADDTTDTLRGQMHSNPSSYYGDIDFIAICILSTVNEMRCNM